MSELLHRSVLGQVGVTLTPLPETEILELLGRRGAPPPPLKALRRAGPDRWYLVGDEAQDMRGLAERLADVAIVDQSHGRVRIAVAGPAAIPMLAKGTAVDLERMAIGSSALTMLGPIGVHLTRMDEDVFELMVLRSFAASLWHDLRLMAEEFI